MNDDVVPLLDEDGRTSVDRWLAEPGHPALAAPIADRVNDPALPDRLAWNAFRTLAAWNTDVWIPSFLEVAMGEDNALSGLEWGDAVVDLWRSGRHLTDAVDVLLDGPEALVLVECTFKDVLTPEHLGEGAEAALGLSERGDRMAGYVLIGPGVDEAEADRVRDALAADLLDLPPGEGHGLRPEAIEHIAGWTTWADLGALTLDLAEEADPLRAEMAHLLVTELQEQYPGIDV